MHKPKISDHFNLRRPSDIKLPQIEFAKRTDKVEAINAAIGDILLPSHPAIQKRLYDLKSNSSIFKDGAIRYAPSAGLEETNRAFLNIIAASGFNTKNLYSQITDGGSQAIELSLLGSCGQVEGEEKSLFLIDASYTNYMWFARRIGVRIVSITRTLKENGKFSLPDIKEINDILEKHKPAAMVAIPYDNPTGHFYNHNTMVSLGRLCVKHNMWMISDEIYREFFYTDEKVSSIWGIAEDEVPGITGRRISIESASKAWNACGLRVGAIVTDNREFHEKSVAEYTSNISANAIGQYVFGALAHEKHSDIQEWYEKQRAYYKPIISDTCKNLKKLLPGLIVSKPEAALFSVVDFRNIAKPGFKSFDFALYCAKKGAVKINNSFYTLLLTPMSGFYNVGKGDPNPGDTQIRIAYTESPERMRLLPEIFHKLYEDFKNQKN